MACFAQLPNEILENVFQFLDFKNRKNLSLVCSRWNDVLMSERYLRRHAILHIEGCRLLDVKCQFKRSYESLSIKLDKQYYNEMTKNLKMIYAFCPSPVYLKVENLCMDQRLESIFDSTYINLKNVEKLHIIGTCKTEKRLICPTLNKLKFLRVESNYIEYFRFNAPNLTELYLYVCSEEHMDLLPQLADHLQKLDIVFDSKDIYYFYNLKFPCLVELSIDRRNKGMTKSEQDISIEFYKQFKALRKLKLSVKFIDSYVIQMISTNISRLTELTLQVIEGTIELSNISKLVNLQKLKIEAEKINLLDARLPCMKQLYLGSSNFRSGTYVYSIDNLMNFDNMRVLALHNVKFFPEIHKLTPSYNVETLYITSYKRLEETHLQILIKRFPAIMWLKIAQCPGFTIREVEKIKRTNPKMCVAFDEVYQGHL